MLKAEDRRLNHRGHKTDNPSVFPEMYMGAAELRSPQQAPTKVRFRLAMEDASVELVRMLVIFPTSRSVPKRASG